MIEITYFTMNSSRLKKASLHTFVDAPRCVRAADQNMAAHNRPLDADKVENLFPMSCQNLTNVLEVTNLR